MVNEGGEVCLSCALCQTRKEKRFCPALHGRICPTCCGREREVTLDCPSDCVYLQQARRNEKPRSLQDVDREQLFLQVEIPENFVYQREPLVVGLSYGLAKTARLDRALRDREAIAALTALAKSYQTLVNSGLHYEAPTASLGQQAILAELQQMITQYRELEQQQLGYSTLRDGDALKAVVFLLRMALGRTSGRPRSRAFLDFLEARFPEKSSLVTSPQEPGSGLVIP